MAVTRMTILDHVEEADRSRPVPPAPNTRVVRPAGGRPRRGSEELLSTEASILADDDVEAFHEAAALPLITRGIPAMPQEGSGDRRSAALDRGTATGKAVALTRTGRRLA